MIQRVHEHVDVITVYTHGKSVFPFKIRWKTREYRIKKIGYHHTERVGRELHHIFHVANDRLAFRLRHNTQNLTWILEEVSDGSPN